MSISINISLNELHCNVESDANDGSEPYIWPVLLWIDNDTVRTPELVGMTAPINDPNQGLWRLVIKSDMRAGETADIPSSVGMLRAGMSELSDDKKFRFILVAVLLWEKDETPDEAVRAGFLVFPSELRAAVAENLIDLKMAIDAEDNTKLEAVKAVIVQRVEKVVESAIRDKINIIDIILGTFNLDDQINNDFFFRDIVKIIPDVDPPFTFTLVFTSESGNYAIQGDGRVQKAVVAIDPCQTQVDAVIAAQNVVNSINSRIESLQVQLQHASPVDKPGLIAKIGIQERKLDAATQKLDAAQHALQTCRSH